MLSGLLKLAGVANKSKSSKQLLGLLSKAQKNNDFTTVYRGVGRAEDVNALRLKDSLTNAPIPQNVRYYQGLGRGSTVRPKEAGSFHPETLWTSETPQVGHKYATGFSEIGPSKSELANPTVLEFKIPNPLLKAWEKQGFAEKVDVIGENAWSFRAGLPEELLTGVHRTNESILKSITRNLKGKKYSGINKQDFDFKEARTSRRQLRRWKHTFDKTNDPWLKNRPGKSYESLRMEYDIREEFMKKYPESYLNVTDDVIEKYFSFKLGTKSGREGLSKYFKQLKADYDADKIRWANR